MIFRVEHTTRYTYDKPVFLEPHTFRLRPRSDHRQTLRQFDLRVEPAPMLLSESLDLDGNIVTRAWFSGLTDSFVIASKFEVETVCPNPFDYLLETSAGQLPLSYGEPLLEAYRISNADESVRKFAAQIAGEQNHKTLSFLFTLSAEIAKTCRQTVRHDGFPHPAHETLARREGTCRDLAVLFIEACRAMGIAARFVSGYDCGDPKAEQQHLHAWAEVYLPGGGWRGYDPAEGLAVSDAHVAVASSPEPRGAIPVTGNFRSSDARGSMQVQIQLNSST